MKNMRLSCVGDNILITLPEVKEKTEGGIIKSPEMVAEELEKMDSVVTEVISIGDRVTSVKVGDKVMLRSTNVAIFTLNGVRMGGIRDFDVFCVVETVEDSNIKA